MIYWCLFISDETWRFNVALFFLACVIIAGIYGAATASKKIFVVQALPAIITLIIFVISRFLF